VPDLYVQTLVRAAFLAGGEVELALRLGVVPSHLHLWILGAKTPPLDVFLKAVDIVLEHDQPKTAHWLPQADEGKKPDGTA
jgi:hypothetical protein